MGGFKLGKMTLGSLFKQPETCLYPLEQKKAPAGRKGFVIVDVQTCILCGICMKRCPCGAIEVDKKGRTWAINHFQCVQCGYCVSECPKKSLVMNPDIPHISTKIEPEVITVPEPKKEEPEGEAKTVEPTGDPDMDAKLAKLPYDKAVKLRAAFMAKQGKPAEPSIEPTGDPDMDAKLAKLPYEKAVKVRAAFMAKQNKESE
ncbi:MAG: 4Fe-4S binding protein [Coriobacteriia bacterium]|nr:4Fe-4S binding protein [Coriobacteriia bacterium]